MTEQAENGTAVEDRDGGTAGPSIRDVLLDSLLSKVAEDRYPSTAMLDLIEKVLTPAHRDEFVEILIDKIAMDRYPSFSLLQRVIRLTA